MNRNDKIEFLNDVKNGKSSPKDLIENPRLEFDYEAMTLEQLKTILSKRKELDSGNISPETEAFTKTLPLKIVSKNGEKKLLCFDHYTQEELKSLLKEFE